MKIKASVAIRQENVRKHLGLIADNFDKAIAAVSKKKRGEE